MNREVSISKRVRTENGLRYCPVVLAANGRVKPDYVLVNGQQERHPEGSYYISWYSGKRLMRLSVGKDAATASNRRQQKEAELNAINNGVAVVTENSDGRTSLLGAVTDYLDEIKLSKKPKTFAAYSTTSLSPARNFTLKTSTETTCSSSRRSSAMRKNSHRAACGINFSTSHHF